MFRLVALVTVYVGLTLGAPQPGVNVPPVDGRIVGGTDADISNYPWTVSLQYRYSHYCGGAIISPTWVLSAAHCVVGYPISIFTIRAGSSAHTAGGQVITLSRIISHPEYNSITADYDITALELTTPITITNASPIPIAPTGGGPTGGTTAIITGWGMLFEDGYTPIVLQVVEVPVISQLNCRLTYGAAVTDRMFCAGVAVGGKDACRGDSGGPVVISGALTGLVSWGNGCARPNTPGVYVNLPALRSWITENTGI